MQAISQGVKKTAKFTLPSFGTFTVRKIKAGKALNPRTGERIKAKPRKDGQVQGVPKIEAGGVGG